MWLYLKRGPLRRSVRLHEEEKLSLCSPEDEIAVYKSGREMAVETDVNKMNTMITIKLWTQSKVCLSPDISLGQAYVKYLSNITCHRYYYSCHCRYHLLLLWASLRLCRWQTAAVTTIALQEPHLFKKWWMSLHPEPACDFWSIEGSGNDVVDSF